MIGNRRRRRGHPRRAHRGRQGLPAALRQQPEPLAAGADFRRLHDDHRPGEGRAALEVPETEARRAGLGTDVPLWVVLDELNADILETSYTLEERSPRGSFGAAFTDAILREVQRLRTAGGLKLSSRT